MEALKTSVDRIHGPGTAQAVLEAHKGKGKIPVLFAILNEPPATDTVVVPKSEAPAAAPTAQPAAAPVVALPHRKQMTGLLREVFTNADTLENNALSDEGPWEVLQRA